MAGEKHQRSRPRCWKKEVSDFSLNHSYFSQLFPDELRRESRMRIVLIYIYTLGIYIYIHMYIIVR